MSFLLFLLRATCMVVWTALGLLLVVVVFPWSALSLRSAMTRRWSRMLLVFCGVNLRVLGKPAPTGPVLWVANHVSWADIFVLNSVRATAFIAKSEIRHWPVIGWLVAGAGTVFIERGRRHAVRAVGHQMKTRFTQGEVIGLFPEGTTSDGFDVAPFHSSLFEAVIRAQVDIQPIALRFFHRKRRSDYAAFVGEQTLLQNLWCLLGTTGVLVECEFLDVIPHDRCMELGRSETAAHAHHEIRQAVLVDHTA